MKRWAVPLLLAVALAVACGDDGDSPEAATTGEATPHPTGTYEAGSRMVDVGGFNLHIVCKGESGPSVVLAGGIGVDTTSWSVSQETLSQSARVCAYDRPGVGASDQRPDGAATGDEIAEEMHTLLGLAGLPPPYVIGGHSIAGIYIRLFQAKYPDEVSGLVFVDGSHEDQLVANDPLTFGDEGGSEVDLSDVRETLSEADDLGDMPVIALHAGNDPALTGANAEFWLGVHRKQTLLSANSMLVVASDSDHFIQERQPDVVAEAIRLVAEAAGSGHPLPDCPEAFADFEAQCLPVDR